MTRGYGYYIYVMFIPSAGGLVLGEGTAASLTAAIQAFRVHPSWLGMAPTCR